MKNSIAATIRVLRLVAAPGTLAATVASFAVVSAALFLPASRIALAGSEGHAQAWNTLKFCAAADEAPFSSRDGSGFENRIAEAVARAMGRKAEFVWSHAPAGYAVRDELKRGMCDVVVGVGPNDGHIRASKPYYRAPYAFVQRKDTTLDIRSWQSPDILSARNIGFVLGTPAQTMLEKLGLFRQHFDYVYSLSSLKDRRDADFARSPPARLVSDVADGTADLAIAFAPEIARYVKGNASLKMTVIPDDNVLANGTKVSHRFDQSLGVRQTDTELASAIDVALETARPAIEAILVDEGMPLLDPPSRS